MRKISENRLMACEGTKQMPSIMANDNEEAIKLLQRFISLDKLGADMCMRALDSLGIYGASIMDFWKKNCHKDFKIFKQTLSDYKNNKISSESIYRRLT